MPTAIASFQTHSPPESRQAPIGELPALSQPLKKIVRAQKLGKPRGKTHCWTPELDNALVVAWRRGGPRCARRAMRQEVPLWSWGSIRKHAASLGLCRPKPLPWSQSDIDHLLWSIDSNASLALIAKRLGRTVGAVRKRLWDLGYRAESLGGYKVKDLAEMLKVLPSRVQYWVEEQLLLTKGGRITESSLTKFLSDCPEKIPFGTLSPEMRSWLCEMGYAQGSQPVELARNEQHEAVLIS